MGYDLLFKGDSRFKNPESQVLLVRFDVSINAYISSPFMSSLFCPFSCRDFVVVFFEVQAMCGQGADGKPNPCPKERVHVYTLFPEYTAITAQDTLLRSHIDSLATQLGGTTHGLDVKTAKRYQTGLQEYLLGVVEYPLQFAIYEPIQPAKTKSFAFAFGRRRRIDKRSGLNPLRWVGSTYTIDYEIEPGPRDLYAVLVVPRNASLLKLTAIASPYLMPERELPDVTKNINETFQQGEEVKLTKEGKEVFSKDGKEVTISMGGGEQPLSEAQITEVVRSLALSAAKKVSDDLKPWRVSAGIGKQLIPKPTIWEIPVKAALPPSGLGFASTFTCEITPDKILPTVTGTLVISCTHPLSPDTEVLVGQLSFSKDQVTLVDRYRVKVSVPPNTAFQGIAKEDDNKLPVVIINAGDLAQPLPAKVASLTLTLQTPVSPELSFVLDPQKERKGQTVHVILTQHLARDVSKVSIGDKDATFKVSPANERTLEVTIPDVMPVLPQGPVAVRVYLNPHAAPPEVLLRNGAFTYLP